MTAMAGRRVLVTGLSTYWGGRVAQELEADDAVFVNRLNERVRNTIQAMLDDALAQRQSVFFG